MRFFASIFLVWSVQANAVIISIDADAFAVGTDLTNAYSGVTLSIEGRSTPVISNDGYNSFLNGNLATTGTSIFGYTPDPSLPPIENGTAWRDSDFGLFRVDFDVLTDFVSIDIIFDDDDIGALWAYNSAGTLLERIDVLGDGRGSTSGYCPPSCDPFVTASVSRSTADIAYILAGGTGTEDSFLDNFQYNQVSVPEPSTFLLLSLALVGVGVARKKIM